MSMTPWIDILGYACVHCGGYATHWYGHLTVCCQCHGGNLVSQEEAKIMHEQGIDGDGIVPRREPDGPEGLGGEPTDGLLFTDDDAAGR